MTFRRAVQMSSLGLVLVGGTVAASPATAGAAVICSPDNQDQCQVDDTVQTPAGPVSVSVSAGNIVTVQLSPVRARTLVRGVPGEIPPGPPVRHGFHRTTFETAGAGTVIIDTKIAPQGPGSPPNLVLIGIHPPSPCRVRTVGNTVVFTPAR